MRIFLFIDEEVRKTEAEEFKIPENSRIFLMIILNNFQT